MTRSTLLEWQATYKEPRTLIVQASHPSGDDSWMPFPIGMCYHYPSQVGKGRSIQIGNHENLVMCAISTSTDQNRRPHPKNRQSILATLARNGIHNHQLPPPVYYDQLPHVKFVISPEGNGIDCHRHYEALIAGAIPVVERHPLTEQKYAGCPILWTDDYSEITPEYLASVYSEMINKEYDFSHLFMDAYDEPTRIRIQECGNHWVKHITKRTWY
jgi:hypothetical protein